MYGCLNFLYQLIYVEAFQKDFHFPGFYFRKIENFIYQSKQMFSGGANLIQIGLKLIQAFFLCIFKKHFAVPNYGIHRRAKLMTHICQKITFSAAGIFCTIPCPNQSLVGRFQFIYQ